MFKIQRLAVAVYLMIAHSTSVDAHARLTLSTPAAGSSVQISPSHIRLQFNEAVEPRFSQIILETKDSPPISVGPPKSDPSDRAVVIWTLPRPLNPGSYTVQWRVVSADTHKIKGSFTFHVRP